MEGPKLVPLPLTRKKTDPKKGFTRAYTDILNNAPESYRTILLHLANEPEKPLILHCTAGKDRTGVICALVLSLCGVDDEIVAHEYSLTEVGLTSTYILILLCCISLSDKILRVVSRALAFRLLLRHKVKRVMTTSETVPSSELPEFFSGIKRANFWVAEWKEAVIEHLSHNPALVDNPEGAKNLISAK